jgi:hypothetical protein
VLAVAREVDAVAAVSNVDGLTAAAKDEAE